MVTEWVNTDCFCCGSWWRYRQQELSCRLRCHPPSADEHASPLVLELKLDGDIEPILATYIDEGLTDAASRHAALVLITMDTPGGLAIP